MVAVSGFLATGAAFVSGFAGLAFCLAAAVVVGCFTAGFSGAGDSSSSSDSSSSLSSATLDTGLAFGLP